MCLLKFLLALIDAKQISFIEFPLPIYVRCSACYFQSLQALSEASISPHYANDETQAREPAQGHRARRGQSWIPNQF